MRFGVYSLPIDAIRKSHCACFRYLYLLHFMISFRYFKSGLSYNILPVTRRRMVATKCSSMGKTTDLWYNVPCDPPLLHMLHGLTHGLILLATELWYLWYVPYRIWLYDLKTCFMVYITRTPNNVRGNVCGRSLWMKINTGWVLACFRQVTELYFK